MKLALKNPFPKQRQTFALLAVFLLVFSIGATYFSPVQAASTTASFSVSPGTGTFTTGTTFTLNVKVSLANNYNASWADLYFNSSRWQYISTTIGSAYNGNGSATLKSNAYGSYLSMTAVRNSGGSLNGSYTLASIQFKALNAGGAYANFGYKRVVLYPTTEYTTASTDGNYQVSNPPVIPPPTPTPTPTPTPSPAPTPTPPKPAPVAKAPSTSPVSKSGLQISDFSITDLGYNTATLKWKTNNPALTKANYSTDKNDLSQQSLDETLATDHTINLSGEDLQAGNHYYVRITSDDGSGPVTIDGEFDTKYISVIVKVTDTNSNPIDSATITVDDAIGISDSDGQASFDLKQGEVSIHASKDNLSTDFTAQVEVPADGDPPQTITIALTDTPSQTTSTSKPKKSSPIGRIIGAFFILLVGAGLTFVLIIRRRVGGSSQINADALEADNYNHPVAPPELPALKQSTVTSSLPPSPGATGPQHHTSLPELVQQHVGTEAVSAQVKDNNVTITPVGNQVPKHTSLKDLVALPQVESTKRSDDQPITNDLPIAPTKSDHHHKHGSTEDNSDDQDQLVIKHLS